MSTAERINLHVQQLPQPFQIEALHFVAFLAAKLQAQAARKDELLWSQCCTAFPRGDRSMCLLKFKRGRP